jgi:hypothetical protein
MVVQGYNFWAPKSDWIRNKLHNEDATLYETIQGVLRAVRSIREELKVHTKKEAEKDEWPLCLFNQSPLYDLGFEEVESSDDEDVSPE